MMWVGSESETGAAFQGCLFLKLKENRTRAIDDSIQEAGDEGCIKYSDLDRSGVKLKFHGFFFRNSNTKLYSGSYKQHPDQPHFKESAIHIILKTFCSINNGI
jgi:hypothetical protein